MRATYEEILQTMLDKVPGDVDKREGSIIYDALAPCAFFLAQQNFQLDNFVDLVFPDTAIGEYLDKAVAPFGVTRKPAIAAIRKMETSDAVAIGSRWGINNLVYVTTEELTAGTEYKVECESTGEVGNQYSGAMQPISNVTGVTAELAGIIEAGTDEEMDEALRARLYQKVRLPATSGNAYHYRLWALEVPGVGDAKVFPLDGGPGTVTVMVVDNDKAVDETIEDTVLAHLNAVKPIGASITVGSPTVTAINVAAQVLLDGSRTIAAVLADYKQVLNDYLRGLVFSDYRVSFARVGSILLSVEGVQDYDGLMLNNTSGNVIIGEKAIPVLGIITLTEESVLGAD